jgi:hypothetical protein
MAAAVNLFVPLPIPLIVIPVGLAILALQIWGSYTLCPINQGASVINQGTLRTGQPPDLSRAARLG